MSDIKCSCGHLRNHHNIEPPYDCNGLLGDFDDCELCDCTGFVFEPAPGDSGANVKKEE